MQKTTVYYNAKITTMNVKRPQASALAVSGNRIVDVGSNQDILTTYKNAATKIDLQNKRVLPGLNDAHAHFLGIGFEKMRLSLKGTSSEEEILRLVAKKSEELVPGTWIKGRGWDQNDWVKKAFPSHNGLSHVTPNYPVALTRIDGHALWCNKKALQVAKVKRETKDPPGGKIIRDINGYPTGILVDTAMHLVLKHIPETSYEETLTAAKLAAKESLKLGITSFQDAGSNESGIAAYEGLKEIGFLRPRLYVMLDGEDENLLKKYYQKGPVLDNFLTIRSVKLYADGALGSRGAALLTPYTDDPKNEGLILMPEEQLTRKTQEAIRRGFQMSIHAIGNKANQIVLNAFESAIQTIKPAINPRLRVEHAQIIAKEDVKRFFQIPAVASVQPTHCTSDMPWAPSRLGNERTKNEAYIWRTLLENKVHLAAGSDAPIESLNPFLGIYAAVSRRDTKGLPKDGFYPEQALTLEEAIHGFTLGAAYAEFREHEKGHLSKGALADFIVLSKDIFEIKQQQIPKTRVDLTILDGQIVYDRSKED